MSECAAGGERGPTRVGIAVIGRGGRYLIRQRPALPGSPMPGYWEFPGGKCHAGESLQACAEREGAEEVGLAIRAVRLRMVREHIYPHGWVELGFFDCELEDPAGEPGAETGFVWVAGGELDRYRFPDGNDAVLAELVAESRAGERVMGEETG